MTRFAKTMLAALALTALGSVAAQAEIFPDSGERRISPREVSRLGCDDLWYARNEIYARRGFMFNTDRGRAVFGDGGYTRNPRLNRYEQGNVAIIQEFEARYGCQ